MNEKLKVLAKGRHGKILREAIEEMMAKVADIRTPMNVKPEIANDVRLGVIQMLEEQLLSPLKVFAGEVHRGEDEYV